MRIRYSLLVAVFLCQTGVLFSGSMFRDALRVAERSVKKVARKVADAKMPAPADLIKNGCYVNLKASNGKYLSFDKSGNVKAVAAAAKDWEKIRVIELGKNRVAFFGVHGNYASARLDVNGAPLQTANRMLGWEQFEVTINKDNTISLKGANDRYLTINPSGDTVFAANVIDAWEKIKIMPAAANTQRTLSDGSVVGILSGQGGKYFSVSQDKDCKISADSAKAGIWERFRLVTNDGINFGFKSDNGKWLTVDSNSELQASADSWGGLETFQIYDGEGEVVYLRTADGRFVRMKGALPTADSEVPVALVLKILPDKDELSFVPIVAKGGLRCGYVSDYTTEWNSANLGVDSEISIYRPKLPKGWVFVGDAVSFGKSSPTYSTMIICDEPGGDRLAKPVKYEEIWNNKKSNKGQKVSIWLPVPPEGYVSLGFVVTRDFKKPETVPSIKDFRCVHKSHVRSGRSTRPIWNDKGSGAEKPLSLFVVARESDDEFGFPAGTFLAGWYNDASIGGAGGGGHTELSPGDDWYLAGIKGRSGSVLDAITPVYRSFSDPKKTKDGASNGGSGGKDFSFIARPGYAVSGLTGNSGALVDSLRVQFMKFNGRRLDPKTMYESALTGGRGGGPYTLGGFESVFQGLEVRSGGNIDAINLVPLPMVEPWVIAGKSIEDVRKEIIDGVTALYLEKNREEIMKEARSDFLKGNSGLAEPSSTTARGGDPFVLPTVPDLGLGKLDLVKQIASGCPVVSSTAPVKKIEETTKTLHSEFDKVASKVSKELLQYAELVTKFLGLENPRFEVNTEYLVLLADLRIKISGDLVLKFDLAVDIPLKDTKSKGVLLRALIKGEWKNPLGISGLTFKKIGFGGNIAFDAKKPDKLAPVLYVSGEMSIGLNGDVRMLAAYDPAKPGLAGMKGELGEVSWGEIFKIADFFCKNATGKSLPALPANAFPFNSIKVENAGFMVAKETVENLDLETGTRLSGDIFIFSNSLGKLEVLFSPDGKTTARANMTEQKIGPLTLSAPLVGKDSKGGPVLVIEHSSAGNSCSIIASVKIAGNSLDYLQNLGKSSQVTLSGNLAGVLPVTLLGKGELKAKSFLPPSDLSMSGFVDTGFLNALQTRVIGEVKKMPGLGDLASAFSRTLVTIESAEVKGWSLAEIAAGKNIPGLTVKLKIAGKSTELSLTNLKLSSELISDIAVKIAEKVAAETGSLAKKFAEALAGVVTNYTNTAVGIGEEIAEAGVKTYEETTALVTSAVVEINNFGKDAGEKLKNFGEKALTGASALANSVGGAIKKFFKW
ncbi:MAG: hypothetical protein GQF41_1931 [Candidatus Rifleibacterium amylolyticum]|nr:MAG: hypothetical protein GQF41_1931 [Candidatus Rifleibacterium amylolyticum]